MVGNAFGFAARAQAATCEDEIRGPGRAEILCLFSNEEQRHTRPAKTRQMIEIAAGTEVATEPVVMGKAELNGERFHLDVIGEDRHAVETLTT